MSSQTNSFVYSANADFINAQLKRWAINPSSVDTDWKTFFDNLNEDVRAVIAEASQPNETSAPPPKFSNAPPDEPASKQSTMDSIRAIMLIRVYRVRGHLQASLDPLGLATQRQHPELDPINYGFTELDYDRPIFLDGSLGFERATLREIMARLQTTYCGHIGVEFMHIQNPEEKAWIQAQMESSENKTAYSRSSKLKILDRLTAAEGFEKFLAAKFVAAKRFGLEGGEAMLPALEAAIARGAELGLKEAVIGMAHRGRLNILTNMLGKPFSAMLAEFNGAPAYPDSVYGSGDVKYHLGASTERNFEGRNVHMMLCANPSHLEWIDPVVTGRVRAKQQHLAGSHALNEQSLREVMALLIHGDAAFAGQGIVGETLTLSALKGYRTGGTLHFVINNQVGFTTSPHYSRSGNYCTEIAKSIQAPIFHVNGDDVEAVTHICELAMEFRQKFHRDAVVDMVCYRRHGHNESDEPSFTQPIMYKAVKNKPTTRDLYVERLIDEGVTTKSQAYAIASEFYKTMEHALHEAATHKCEKSDWLEERDQAQYSATIQDLQTATAVNIATLREVGLALSRAPTDFDIHPKISRQLEAKRIMTENGQGIDWATAEALAFGTLLVENHPVRLSGQDSRRGTFSQRHSVLVDQTTERRYTPLNNLHPHQAYYDVHDSPLSEAAVMGFDYGFSLSAPTTLVCWEAQFGDFANTAQVFIDQFISSAGTKWSSESGLVLLLPHGHEGQGPEHSSARIERYLQLCAEDNMQVANCSTPANYFHILRRQVLRKARKPLIVMTPKSLLRHKSCVSNISAMSGNSTFMSVLPETSPNVLEPSQIRRVVICSGKVFYDLNSAREDRGIKDIAILRLEQLYPFPAKHLAAEIGKYSNAHEIVWCQEEPKNMGAWSFIDRRIEDVLFSIDHPHPRPTYAGRPEAAAPATGSLTRHNAEQATLINDALSSL